MKVPAVWEKSWICREFGQREYESLIFVDFNEEGESFAEDFNAFRGDLDGLFFFLQSYYNTRLVERKSLIVLDEIQKNPKAREMLKYLVQDGRFDYIETGSLVSIQSAVASITIPSEEVPLELALWISRSSSGPVATRSSIQPRAVPLRRGARLGKAFTVDS